MTEPAPTPLKLFFYARIVRIVDGDTAVVDPEVYPQDQNLRIRFKDVWAPEMREEGGPEAKELAELEFPVDTRVMLSNTRIHWVYGRLEARVDHTDAYSVSVI